MSVSAVIFDFDGTLVETRAASWELFRRTNEAFQLGVDSAEDFYQLFRINFHHSLEHLCNADPGCAEQVRSHFLELLRRDYDPPLVPGMADVVRTLAGHLTLVLISANAMAPVRRVLSSHGLATCFAHVFTGDVEVDKAAAMRRFLSDSSYATARRCQPNYLDRQQVVPRGESTILVTDTVGDVEAARAAGVRPLGVVWGMHTEAELLAAGAEHVAIWPQEIIAFVMEEGGGPGQVCSAPTEARPGGRGQAWLCAREAAAARRRREPRPLRSGMAERSSFTSVAGPAGAAGQEMNGLLEAVTCIVR